MTDNRTTELREKLTECGVEYTTNDHMGAYETSWNGFTAMQLTPGAKLLMVFTPEQAIAATLVSDAKPCYATDYTHEHCKYSVNRGWVENVAHGTLTAKQVSKATYAHSIHADCADADWQAIADELNAELGSGTCEVECFDDGVDEGIDGEWFSYAPPTWYLSCGHMAQGTEMPNFCPVCGKAVKR